PRHAGCNHVLRRVGDPHSPNRIVRLAHQRASLVPAPSGFLNASQPDSLRTVTDDTHGGVVRRRTARSGVDYSQEVTLHETSRMRIILRSWFIPHDTRPTGLSIKLERVRRSERGFVVGAPE